VDTAPVVQMATLPPGFRTRAARAQKRGMLNQWAAVEAVMRSTLESGMGGERCEPRSSAVEMSKRRLGCVVEVRAVLIMPSEGSRPITFVKWGARARAVVPGPQPMSRRVSRWPPVEVWWSMTVSG
jgi:hypothetical protein